MTEFNLSKKKRLYEEGKWGYYYDEKDIQEIIRLLKDRLHYNIVEKEAFISFSELAFQRDIIEEIDKLTGEDLI